MQRYPPPLIIIDLLAPATLVGAPSTRPPPGPAGSIGTIHGPSHGRTRNNDPREESAPSRPSSVPPTTPTQGLAQPEAFEPSIPHLGTDTPQPRPHSFRILKPAQEYAAFNQHTTQLISSGTPSSMHPVWIAHTDQVWSTMFRSAQTSPLFQLRHVDTTSALAPNRSAQSI
ncbi:hypothetical protein F511_12609 [Dorcoceras hygrometricum]|uniref:Uncharacterized protein n=1 Tax=Dorcoceras hygrometricum TaxID=472368 RepID=A0A2Z7CAW2_9LAMI|nr:hypothetical protein F511_12609 [Dorcoceras hygrometricum]